MITGIDFYISEHIIRVHNEKVFFFINGYTGQPPIEFDLFDIERILKISEEQVEG